MTRNIIWTFTAGFQLGDPHNAETDMLEQQLSIQDTQASITSIERREILSAREARRSFPASVTLTMPLSAEVA